MMFNDMLKVLYYLVNIAAIALGMFFAFHLSLMIWATWTTDEKKTGGDATATSKWVCGKLHGHAIEVLRKYIVLWAEYEGKSSWEPGFTENKKGCDANLVSLPLVMSWPEMQPANHTLFLQQGPEFVGLAVTIVPLSLKRLNDDMRYKLGFLGEYTPQQRAEKVSYIESLGLFFIDRNDRALPGEINRNSYYWPEERGKVPVFFKCRWSPFHKKFYTCDALFAMPEIGALVKVRFTPEKMEQWKEIISAPKEFLLSKITHDEVWEFHRDVFTADGLPPETWTLHSVLSVLPKNDREPYWQNVLNAAGKTLEELQLSYSTYQKMALPAAITAPTEHSFQELKQSLDTYRKIVLPGMAAPVGTPYRHEKGREARDWLDRIQSPARLWALSEGVIQVITGSSADQGDTAPNLPAPPPLINIDINPAPQPQQHIQDEDQARRDVSNGYLVNTPTYRVSFQDGTLNKTDFFQRKWGVLPRVAYGPVKCS